MRRVGPRRAQVRTAALAGAALVAAAAGCVFAAVGSVAADGSRAEAAAGPATTAG
ncbi:hypothetical protein GT352_18760, partial [Streptomyces sp. SID1046]|nr:hypothetical protein [Streptomyces sp. SID1046]